MPSAAEKKAAERQEKELKEGRFVAQESGDNALDAFNPAYVGIDPEYANSAYDTTKALQSEDEETKAIEDHARSLPINDPSETTQGSGVGFQGYTVDKTHPTDRTKEKGVVAGGADAAASVMADGFEKLRAAGEAAASDELGQPTEGDSSGGDASTPPFSADDQPK